MGSKNAPERKKFRVAVSGSTIDGREIPGEMLRRAAENYDPSIYGSRVNIEHALSMWPSSELCAMGDLIALSTDEITEGKLAGRTALYAEIEPTERMKNMLSEGKKVYSSIELLPDLDAVQGPYIVGLAMTDTPASLGTERLKFAAQQRASIMQFNNRTSAPSMFTEAMEAELLTTTEQHSEEGRQWFSRVMSLISKTRGTDSEQFSQIREVVENIASDHADLLDRFTTLEQKLASGQETMKKLNDELAALKMQLKTLDADPQQRFIATGGNDQILAEF
ncbi:GPO family capsid scaffolding protein [Escherichia coli]|nr:GPO family capsid scaffolding protein [Escherichia coli]